MQYPKYRSAIEAKLGVRINWPKGVPFQADIQQTQPIKDLLAALQNGTCRWERIPTDELTALRADVAADGPAPRRIRSDKHSTRKHHNDGDGAEKGVKRKRKAISAPEVHSSGEDEEGDHSPPPRKKSRKELAAEKEATKTALAELKRRRKEKEVVNTRVTVRGPAGGPPGIRSGTA